MCSQHHSNRSDQESALSCVAPAVSGFFRSVALGQAAGDRTGNLQDILRLLTLWFNYGHYPDVERALQEGFNLVSIDTWLVVIPQVGSGACMLPALYARMNSCLLRQLRSQTCMHPVRMVILRTGGLENA